MFGDREKGGGMQSYTALSKQARLYGNSLGKGALGKKEYVQKLFFTVSKKRKKFRELKAGQLN